MIKTVLIPADSLDTQMLLLASILVGRSGIVYLILRVTILRILQVLRQPDAAAFLRNCLIIYQRQ
jgi:hypothetical protein